MAGWWCAARGHTWHLLSALRAPVGGGAGCFVRYLGCVNKPLDHNRFHIFRRIRNSWRHVMGWEREREKRRVPIKKWNHFLHFLFHFAHYLRRGSCRSSLSFFFFQPLLFQGKRRSGGAHDRRMTIVVQWPLQRRRDLPRRHDVAPPYNDNKQDGHEPLLSTSTERVIFCGPLCSARYLCVVTTDNLNGPSPSKTIAARLRHVLQNQGRSGRHGAASAELRGVD